MVVPKHRLSTILGATYRNIRAKFERFRVPGVCLLCGGANAETGLLCPPCEADLPLVTNACPQCARPLPTAQRCGRCLDRPPPYTQTHCVFDYGYPLDKLITALKYGGKPELAAQLGRTMAKYLDTHLDAPIPQCIIPVPLHRRRLIWRGFNQSLELARPIARTLALPIYLGCKRVRDTPPQVGLPAKQRRKNIRAAFKAPKRQPYTHVAIVDDVVTTGSTVTELAKTLKRVGVKRVDVWVCSRAYLRK